MKFVPIVLILVSFVAVAQTTVYRDQTGARIGTAQTYGNTTTYRDNTGMVVGRSQQYNDNTQYRNSYNAPVSNVYSPTPITPLEQFKQDNGLTRSSMWN
jgi:hypothetical protein